ncbi:periplasmic heavy metal sensor [Marinimicrococcus flavescens]|uniref:Periplasmic heavy metal sensor n=1 Tax=Marinimicrococcus flavescens TaxID=3031815 RepID=A0AAP3UYQ0_9PROT|nr:periplasmic heavy metal sensor [Marinimicrococcus flavescens]
MTIRGRWAWALLALLVLSLGANLLVAGISAGRHFAGPRVMGAHHGRSLAGGLPEEAREAVREAFAERGPELRRRIAATREASERALELLRAPELDEAALAAAFATLRARSGDAQALVHEALAEGARNLPPGARAEWRPRMLAGGPRRGH